MATNGHTNGAAVHAHFRPLTPGVYAPIPAFFDAQTDELDIPTFETHVLRVARAGVGLVISGSMGEAHHLSHDERKLLIRTARHALDTAEPSLSHVPIIAGTGGGSTRETILLSKEAAEAGADVAIVICSGYYAGALDKKALTAFFTEVADKSPIPVLVYNYPGAAGGIELDSDLILSLAEHPNICGVKLTCGNVGKLTRIAAGVTPAAAFAKAYPRKHKEAATVPFLVLGGFIDFLVPSLYANAHGAITGLGNVAPNAISHLYKLATDPSQLAEAQRLQGIIANGDRTVALTGIGGTKYLLKRFYGYGGAPRRPLLPFEEENGEKLWNHPHVVALLEEERKLTK
ncbi:hypothetical protein M422DRAFT_209315 [Sphaerobolus stellatus SS14]|uniref:4-hydroxy-tetrahydrodipicolinate synthase n=1 Tax=Sphaerobolus stellatus (strain SS14) TaxID=990650 RepID=A0A0C9UDQ7_SPHS4|nr:hypothetical protein M422DRAFT_209315 [Sphaerobolus stellatus SS14]